MNGFTDEFRHAIFEAQNWRCCYCGVEMLAGQHYEDWLAVARRLGVPYLYKWRIHYALKYRVATIEHLVRKADSGSDDPDNLVGACGYCNHARQEMDAMEWFDTVQVNLAVGYHPHQR